MDRDKIEDKLLQLGITPNLRGFNYLVSAIATYQFDMPMMELYTTVADEYSTESSRVERCIRHAKDKCPDYLNMPNSEFIALISLEVKRNVKRAVELEAAVQQANIIADDFADACKYLMEYLKKYHPHVKAIVTSNTAELLEGITTCNTLYGKDGMPV